MPETGVYCWTNLVNGKVYVGSTARSFAVRKKEYLKGFRKGKAHNTHFQNAIRKHGMEAFEWSVLERCPPEECLERETRWIAHLDSTNKDSGYNVCKEGKNKQGVPCNEETRAKIAAAKHGLPGPMVGKNHTEASRKKMSESAKKRKPNHCVPHTEVGRANISTALRGKRMSEETRKRMSNGQKKRQQARRLQPVATPCEAMPLDAPKINIVKWSLPCSQTA